jgi:hypothetical protein
VAFEPGGGMSNGRPVSIPEPPGSNKPGAAYPKFAANGNRIIGEVRDFHDRTQKQGQLNFTVWSFRVDRYDASGNLLQPVPVEVKGEIINGSISDGDWVELPGDWKSGQIAQPEFVKNLTTGATVQGYVTPGSKISVTIGYVFFCSFLLVAAFFFIMLVVLPILGIIKSLLGG